MTVVYGKMRRSDDYYVTKAYPMVLEWNSLPAEPSHCVWLVPGTSDPDLI